MNAPSALRRSAALLPCLMCVDSLWVHGRPFLFSSPISHPGLTCPMCPDSVWSGLLFLENTFILILITNSFAYDLHPSARAQVWKHLRLTIVAWLSPHTMKPALDVCSDVPGYKILLLISLFSSISFEPHPGLSVSDLFFHVFRLGERELLLFLPLLLTLFLHF